VLQAQGWLAAHAACWQDLLCWQSMLARLLKAALLL
jgi:hypothetical protein